MNRPTILIVDDEALMTEMLGMVLKLSLPVDVVTTNSSRRAVEILAQEDISLVITDYLMPDLNGLNLIRDLRAHGKTIPVIILTGYCDEPELAANAESLQPFEVIVKPWDNEHLLRQIRARLPELN